MTKFKFNHDGTITFERITYPGEQNLNKNITLDVDKWIKSWEEIIEEIKSQKFEYFQIQDIHSNWVHDILSYGYTNKLINRHQDINKLSTKLKIAFEISYSNYRDSKKGFYGFLLGLFTHKLIDVAKLPNNFNIK